MIFRFLRTEEKSPDFVLDQKLNFGLNLSNFRKLSFLRVSVVLLLTLLPFANSFGQIASEGLNNSSTLFTLTGGAYFTGTSATGDRPASVAQASEGTHARGINSGTATLTSSNINTTGYTGVALSFKLASHSVSSTGNGADAGDIVTVEVSPNGGTNYYSTLRILGPTASNAWWDYTASGVASTAYDGNTTPVDFQPAGTGERTTDGYSTITVTSLPIATNVRVRITLLNNATGEKWLIDDFRVTGTSATPCSGTPTPGNTLAATNPVLNGSSTVLSLSGTLTGSGITYQWQSSSDNVTYTDIASATNSTYTATMTAKTWFRCVATCSGSSAVSTPVEVTMAYCTSSPTSNDGSGVTGVTVGSATFPVGDIFYFNYTSSIPNLTQGAAITSSVSFATGYDYDTHIWIDLNDDGVFNNTNEKVFTGVSSATNPTTLNTSFTLSAGATIGQHKMRIGTADVGQASPLPCYSGTYGVTIDLYVNILAASVNPVLAITGTTAHGSSCPTVAASSQTYTITNSGSGSASGLTVVSNDPQFVVSGLSSTTVAGSGGTVTYVVTFTPSSTGAKTATITVASSTSGSNSPTSSLTGTGTATVSPVAVTAAATSIGAYEATLGAASGTVFGVCPTTTSKGFVISQTSANATPTVGGSGVANETVALGTTGAYTKALSALLPGTNYSFRAYIYDGTTYTYGSVLTFTTLSPPANDLCGSATSLTVNAAAVSGTLVNATNTGSSGLSYANSKKDVWYSFTPSCSGKFTVEVSFNTSSDIDVDMFTASCPTSGTAPFTSHSTSTEIITATLTSGVTYYVRVIAYDAAAESAAFTISVNNQMTIFTHPSSASAASGATANFASSMPTNATGYQWQVSTDGGTNWNNVSTGTGATNNTYTTAAVSMSMSGYKYRVVISNGNCTTVTSNPATLTVTSCTSVPTSNDNSGITNMVVGSASSAVSDVTFFNYSASIPSLTQGEAITSSLTFATGYAYATHIWIDFNDDGDFDNATEKVYSGESAATNPTTLNTSFTLSGTAALGQHRMRIGTADDGQATPNPCYSGSFGVTIDLNVNIIASCVQPSAPATPTSNSPQCLPGGVTVSQVGSAPAGEVWYWQTTATGTDMAAINSAATYTVTSPGTTTIYLRSRTTATSCWGPASSISVTNNAATAITTQPASQTAYVGTSATFSVVATGGGLTHQWQVNTGSGWNNVTGTDGTGGTTSSFTTVATTMGMTGYFYRVVVNGSCGNVTSNGLATLTVSSVPLCAPIWEENFDYGCVSTTTLPTTSGNVWPAFSSAGSTFNYTASSLHYAGYASSGIGGSAEMTSAAMDVRREIQGTDITSGTVYSSFLVNLNTNTTTSSEYFISLMNSSSAYHGRVYARKSGSNLQLGVSKFGTGISWSGNLSFGTTYLVVIKYEFIAGGNNDIFKMWVIPGGVPASEAAAGTSIDAPVNETDAANFRYFVLRQDNAQGFVDGVRIATNWSDAVCAGATVAPSAGTYTWTGSGNTTSWTNACNWSPQGIPGAADNVIFNTSPTWKLNITDSRTVNDFTLNGTGNFDMASTGILTINGNVTYGGTATATMNCNSKVYITSTSSQPIPPLNYGTLDALGGNRVFPNGGTIGICGGFNVDPTVHTYTVTGSTVDYFSPTSNWVMIPFTYNNLKFSGTGDWSLGYSATNANKTINVQGNYIQTNGTFYLGENSSATATMNIDGNMTISGGTFDVNYYSGGSGIVNLKGNLTVNGGSLSSTTAINGFVKFIGTNQQDVSVAGTNNIYNVEVNKGGGSVNLLSNFQSKRTLNMVAGNVVTNTFIFELGESTTNKGTLTYTSGYILGKMRRWFNGTNANDNATSLFPLGRTVGGTNKNRFVRVNYTVAPTGGHLTAQFVGSPMGIAGLTILAANTGGFGSDVTTTEDEGYWQIDNQALTNGTYTIACTGEGLSLATITNYTGVTLLKRVGGGNWLAPGTHIATTGSNGIPTVSRSGMTGWSNFGFGGNSSNPLPVELMNFSASCENGTVTASWATASEKNSDYFILQSSGDMGNWTDVSTVPAAGNSSSRQDYNAADLNAARGVSYYRLVQVDFDGNKKSYSPVSVNCADTGTEFLAAYPNPSTGAFAVAWNMEKLSGTIHIALTSSTGALISEKTVQVSEGKHMVPFHEELESGIYYITLRGENGTETLKLVVKN